MAVIRINEIIDRLISYHDKADTAVVQKAYVWSAKLHAGSLRKSGLPYLSHPLEVAGILTQLELHENSIAAGLLHDVIEDSSITLEELEAVFGKEIASLVDGVTKIGKITTSSRIEVQSKNYRKMILAMAQDVRVILIKLADRLHNMQTLEYLDEKKQSTIAQETLDIYAPIAGRLGIHWIQAQLEDLSFRHLKPEIYFRLATEAASIKEARQEYKKEVQQIIKSRLHEAGIEAKVTGRFKHLYSIYEKMERQKLSFDEVHDIIAFRIIVGSIPDCYDTLRVLHSYWTPVPGRIKDYIALSKPNMYRSLHTAVIGPEGERTEIQIRTQEMHAVAEYGIAAHWRYKQAGASTPDADAEEKTLEFLHQLVEFHEELKDPYRFYETLKSEVILDEIVVFTPTGDLIELPTAATPIDFAYAIHSDIGNQCGGAKINGRIVPLNHILQSGDTVQILTSTSVEPSKAWLEIVKSSRAKAKISHWISAKEGERTKELGRQLLESELLRHHRALGTLIENGDIARVASRFRFSSTDTLFEAIGFGKFPVRKVVTQIVPPQDLRRISKRKKAVKSKKKTTSKKGKTKTRKVKKPAPETPAPDEQSGEVELPPIVIKSFNDPVLAFGACCSPLMDEEVAAVRDDEEKVEIHRADCKKVMEAHPEWILPASWADHVEGESEVTIEVVSMDRKGMLAKLSTLISEADLNIVRALVNTTAEKKAIISFAICIKHLSDLRRIIKAIEKVEGVISVSRLNPRPQ